MAFLISDLLRERFNFTGDLGGPEFENYSLAKQEVCEQLLTVGIEYQVYLDNFKKMAKANAQYAEWVQKVAEGTSRTVPLYVKFHDLKSFRLALDLMDARIRGLIRVFNAM